MSNPNRIIRSEPIRQYGTDRLNPRTSTANRVDPGASLGGTGMPHPLRTEYLNYLGHGWSCGAEIARGLPLHQWERLAFAASDVIDGIRGATVPSASGANLRCYEYEPVGLAYPLETTGGTGSADLTGACGCVTIHPVSGVTREFWASPDDGKIWEMSTNVAVERATGLATGFANPAVYFQSDDSAIVLLTDLGELWVSTDGTTWTQSSSDLTTTIGFADSGIAIAHNGADLIAIGFGDEASEASVSDDSGVTWSAPATLDTSGVSGGQYAILACQWCEQLAKWIVVTGAKDLAEVITTNVYTSSDGVSWTLENSGGTGVAFAGSPGVVLGSTIIVPRELGLFYSDDLGNSWRAIHLGATGDVKFGGRRLYVLAAAALYRSGPFSYLVPPVPSDYIVPS